MVIPDSDVHANGQTIITHTYSIFLDTAGRDPRQSASKEATLHLERIEDPDYYGYLTRQGLGQLFTYMADGNKELSTDEVEQLIKQIRA